MRGDFTVNGATMTYKVSCDSKGYHYSLDAKAGTHKETIFTKVYFAQHIVHSAERKFLKESTLQISVRNILKVMHNQFREELE